MRKEKKYNYIYKTTCLVTNRFYIGLHSTDNLDDGYMGSGKRLWYSFKKYGKENHKVEILEYFKTRKELKQRERELVTEELIGEELCMNLALGGTGGILNEEHLISFTKAGGKAFKEKLNNDPEFREKHIKNVTKNLLKAHKEGKIKYGNWSGKKHSEETKQKMRKSKNVGVNNSQYGTMWINNSKINKKIKKTDNIPDGWVKGMLR